MKRASTLLILLSLLGGLQELQGQTLTFVFKNPQVITGGKFQYEIWLKSSTGPSRMGEILVYNDYDTTTFGTNVVENGRVTVTKNSTLFGDSYSTNPNQDNTPSRFAFSWTYLGSSGSGVIIPSTGDGVLAYTVQIDVVHFARTSGMTFNSLMNGEQYFEDHTAWPSIDITNRLDILLVGVAKEEAMIPQSFMLYPNSPNPFNPSTTITYDLPSRSFVSLKIYNTLGQEVAILVNEMQAAGRYHVDFGANNLASGAYFCRLTTDLYNGLQKMLLLK